MSLLRDRLSEAGITDVDAVRPVGGGMVATAGLVRMRDQSQRFAKTFADAGADLFEVEAEGLRALRELGGATTPEVLLVAPRLLVLQALRPRPDGHRFWERLGHMVGELHRRTIADRFGWHRPGWLGRLRQDNAWDEDGYAFYAQRRILRWLPEPLVAEAFDREERDALERLCGKLPELVPKQPPALTHGDLWTENILADPAGDPALIDPAVSYNWPETDLSMFYRCPRPPESDRFFDAYQEVAELAEGWRERTDFFILREWLSTIAHGDDTWGAVDAVRKVIAPFRSRSRSRAAPPVPET